MSFLDQLSATISTLSGADPFQLSGALVQLIDGTVKYYQEANAPVSEADTRRMKTTMARMVPINQWHGTLDGRTPGLYQPTYPPEMVAPHPCQDPSFPFIYDPSVDEYIGFRWDYGDVGPLTPPLTPEVLATMGGLYLSPGPTDYYCAHGGHWPARFTVVGFKKPQYYRSLTSALDTNRMVQGCELTDAGEKSGDYMRYNLHPQAASLAAVGFGAILSHAAPNTDPGELFLFDPKTQVTRTSWVQWGN